MRHPSAYAVLTLAALAMACTPPLVRPPADPKAIPSPIPTETPSHARWWWQPPKGCGDTPGRFQYYPPNGPTRAAILDTCTGVVWELPKKNSGDAWRRYDLNTGDVEEHGAEWDTGEKRRKNERGIPDIL